MESYFVGLLLLNLAFMAVMGVLCLRVKGTGTGAGEASPQPRRGQENAPEMEQLKALRERSLTTPLTELARPASMEEIIGQGDGILALRAALCGPNPQHVLIYGPPGVGKTCAARLVLEEAKGRPESPFDQRSAFVEIDATCVRFDERAIADPLLGSVHDPIYQGAGPLGGRGVPQPKAGAVTRAHCGILFLDEIGEMHPLQLNKLLKVLEDRRVRFESAYYTPGDPGVPAHIRDVFDNGLPADFRLVGATTRRPEELPSALRSRCVELFFRSLELSELQAVALGAALRAGIGIEPSTAERIAAFSSSGREAVNIVQLAGGAAGWAGRKEILPEDVDWVARTCRRARQCPLQALKAPRAGVVGMLAVAGADRGVVLELECAARRSEHPGVSIAGAVETEELRQDGRTLIRKSAVACSMENAVSAVGRALGMDLGGYAIRFNIPGGLPADGPSAGAALAAALVSALTNTPPAKVFAATGEITLLGELRPVGGMFLKLRAAERMGVELAAVPWETESYTPQGTGMEIVRVKDVAALINAMMGAKDCETYTFPTWFADCEI